MVYYPDYLSIHTNPFLLITNKKRILILLQIIISEPSAPPNNVEAIDIDTNQVTIRWRVSTYPLINLINVSRGNITQNKIIFATNKINIFNTFFLTTGVIRIFGHKMPRQIISNKMVDFL